MSPETHAPLQERLTLLSERAGVHYATLLIERSEREDLVLKNGTLEPPALSADLGLQVSVYHQGGAGYACSGELSVQGLTRAFGEALVWAEATRARAALDSLSAPTPHPRGSY